MTTEPASTASAAGSGSNRPPSDRIQHSPSRGDALYFTITDTVTPTNRHRHPSKGTAGYWAVMADDERFADQCPFDVALAHA